MTNNSISYFYNFYSQQIIDACCDNFSYEKWGINNFKAFNFNHTIDTLNIHNDTKLFKRILYMENWSYINIKNNYCFIATSNIKVGKELLNVVGKENNLQSACLLLGDFDSIFLEKDDIEIFLNTGKFENHIFKNHIEKNRELNELIKELKLLDCCEQIFVFGSIITGKIVPPDLDIWIDATELELKSETQDKILKLVQKYSLRLDPYIKTVKAILAVDANIFTYEFNWIDLKSTDKHHIFSNFEQWEKEARSGQPLHCISLLPITIKELTNNKAIDKKLKF